ncbi:unnamed protein product, partial [Phaeothamnion confervicola]
MCEHPCAAELTTCDVGFPKLAGSPPELPFKKGIDMRDTLIVQDASAGVNQRQLPRSLQSSGLDMRYDGMRCPSGRTSPASPPPPPPQYAGDHGDFDAELESYERERQRQHAQQQHRVDRVDGSDDQPLRSHSWRSNGSEGTAHCPPPLRQSPRDNTTPVGGAASVCRLSATTATPGGSVAGGNRADASSAGPGF